jgi:hypothetical protein
VNELRIFPLSQAAMSEIHADVKRPAGWAFYALALVGAVALYVASLGPVYAVTSRWGGATSSRLVETFYKPLVWAVKGTDRLELSDLQETARERWSRVRP